MKTTIRTLIVSALLVCGALVTHADTEAIAPVGKKVTIEIQGAPKATRQTTYTWYKDGIKTKIYAPWLVLEHAKTSDSGVYKVVINTPTGTIVSDEAKVTVVPARQ